MQSKKPVRVELQRHDGSEIKFVEGPPVKSVQMQLTPDEVHLIKTLRMIATVAERRWRKTQREFYREMNGPKKARKQP